MIITKDEYLGFGFKCYSNLVFCWIWILSFLLDKIELEFMLFFWTSSQLSV